MKKGLAMLLTAAMLMTGCALAETYTSVQQGLAAR